MATKTRRNFHAHINNLRHSQKINITHHMYPRTVTTTTTVVSAYRQRGEVLLLRLIGAVAGPMFVISQSINQSIQIFKVI